MLLHLHEFWFPWQQYQLNYNICLFFNVHLYPQYPRNHNGDCPLWSCRPRAGWCSSSPSTIITITMSSSIILIVIKKAIAHFDLVGQEQADGLQALLSSEKETFSIIYVHWVNWPHGLIWWCWWWCWWQKSMTKSMTILSKTCPHSLPRRDSWPPGGSLRTQTASEGLCIARGCLLQRITI